MHSKLAGRLPLQEMISQHIESARVKLAASDEKDEKVKKLVDYEKKEHGGKIPSVKEEKEEHEKKASIDFHEPEHIEKLAAALEYVAEKLASDGAEMGGEKPQGGQQLATQKPTPGKQNYQFGKAKHQIPAPTMQTASDNPGAANVMATDDKRAPGGNGAKYPAKGVLKTAGESVMARIEAKRAELEAATPPAPTEEEVEQAEKKAGAADFILSKISEATQGGMTLDSASGQGPKPPSNPGRQLISSNSAPASATKREAKEPRKKELKEVLTEPAFTRSTDPVVQNNLRNASKGGVKIAAAKAYLSKIASEGCTCSSSGECRHCKLAKAIESRKAS